MLSQKDVNKVNVDPTYSYNVVYELEDDFKATINLMTTFLTLLLLTADR